MTSDRRDDAWAGIAIGWSISSTLLAGMLVLGGLGFLLDRLLGTGRGCTAAGIVLGAVAGIYIIYLRFGKEDRGADDATRT